MNLTEICKFYSDAKQTDKCETDGGHIFCQSCRVWRRQFLDAKELHGFSDADLVPALQSTILAEAAKQKWGLELHDAQQRGDAPDISGSLPSDMHQLRRTD